MKHGQIYIYDLNELDCLRLTWAKCEMESCFFNCIRNDVFENSMRILPLSYI